MGRRWLLVWGIVLASITILSVAVLDRPLATAIVAVPAGVSTGVNAIITAIEVLFGFPLSKWFTGFVLLASALGMFALRRWPSTAWLLLFLAATQLTTRLVAGVLKNVFLRPRPFEALAAAEWRGQFFTEGSSFPSGHAAHFWPLFFGVAMAFPRWRWPLLVLALFVSFARVVVNDHYMGDVMASATIAAFVTYGYASIPAIRRRLAQNVASTSPAAVQTNRPVAE